jgi:NAD(P)-dependent dehydrogenase (short-subunit alcohol dehydrogenase family)
MADHRGRAFTQAALGRGDTVVATVRTDDALTDLASPRLIGRRLDVAGREAVRAVVASVDVPDVVVNNAGYGLVGAIEELSEAEVRAQLDVNLLGALWVSQAVLRHAATRVREDRAGVDGRRGRPPAAVRGVQRVEVGAGGVQRRPGRRGAAVRHRRAPAPAGRLRHRLGRLEHALRHGRPGVRGGQNRGPGHPRLPDGAALPRHGSARSVGTG